jgi:hypothetical protein
MSREPTRQSSFHCRKACRKVGGKADVGIELATVLAGTGRPGNCLQRVLWDSLPLVAHAVLGGNRVGCRFFAALRMAPRRACSAKIKLPGLGD